MAIERIRENQTGVENKHWKKHQALEAVTDLKVWLFVLFSLLDNSEYSCLRLLRF
jgi:ACS family allantoate permease-like MFS transporter